MSRLKIPSFAVNPSYTHFAVNSDGKIVTGWDYSQCEDRLERDRYARSDLKDMFPELKSTNFKVLTTRAIKQKFGLDPFNWESWVK